MQINRDADATSYGIYGYAKGEVTILVPRRFAGPAGSEPSALEELPTGGTVRRETYHASLLVMPDRLVTDWPPQRFEDLAPEHFEVMASDAPEVVLFGSGATLRHPDPRLYAALTRRGIGVETMDTGSACRTYNFLMTDRRRVLAALLMIG